MLFIVHCQTIRRNLTETQHGVTNTASHSMECRVSRELVHRWSNKAAMCCRVMPLYVCEMVVLAARRAARELTLSMPTARQSPTNGMNFSSVGDSGDCLENVFKLAAVSATWQLSDGVSRSEQGHTYSRMLSWTVT